MRRPCFLCNLQGTGVNFMRVKWYVPYLFVLPAFLLIVVVLYNPIVQNMYTSLFRTAAFSS